MQNGDFFVSLYLLIVFITTPKNTNSCCCIFVFYPIATFKHTVP